MKTKGSPREVIECAYARLKSRVNARGLQLEENGFVVICPHCLNDDIEKMYFLETVVEIRKIIRVANGTICFGESVDSDWTGEYALGCDVCHKDFALPTKAGTDYADE